MSESKQIFQKHIDPFLDRFPNFKPITNEQGSILRGEIDVNDENLDILKTFDLKITGSPNYPYQFPRVYEISNHIPRIADWHVYSDGSFCLDVPQSETIKCNNGITLVDFTMVELIPYLNFQTHRLISGYYPGEEYSHGIEGIFEFYSEVLGTIGDVLQTISLLTYIANSEKPIRTSKCFCESGKLFRKCHKAAWEKLIELGRDRLQYDIQQMFMASKIPELIRINNHLQRSKLY